MQKLVLLWPLTRFADQLGVGTCGAEDLPGTQKPFFLWLKQPEVGDETSFRLVILEEYQECWRLSENA